MDILEDLVTSALLQGPHCFREQIQIVPILVYKGDVCVRGLLSVPPRFFMDTCPSTYNMHSDFLTLNNIPVGWL